MNILVPAFKVHILFYISGLLVSSAAKRKQAQPLLSSKLTSHVPIEQIEEKCHKREKCLQKIPHVNKRKSKTSVFEVLLNL